MIRFLQKIVDFFVYSNIFIALAAFVFTLQTAIEFNHSALAAGFFAFTNFIATFSLYNIQRVYQSSVFSGTEKLSWYVKNKRLLFTLILVFCSLYLLVFIQQAQYFITGLLLYIPVIALSLFYFVPPFSLRQKPYFKIFIIGLVWVYTSCFIPLLYEGIDLTGVAVFSLSEWMYIIAQFLFISAICIPFDIRDINTDDQLGIKTLPVQLGVDLAKKIGMGMLVGYILLSQNIYQGIVFAITGGLGIALIYYSQDKKHRYYFSILVDGLIILQFMLYVYLFSY
ncbi:MAG: UbiA family prenyltransferase [Bacteroidia bacterium]